jgi:hypothetical protein
MRNRHRTNRPLDGLRLAIDCMPLATREAMLEGLRRYERILVGAYVDEHGGVCPMLAAHRCGGRTDLLAFAKSWDRFARARGRDRGRVATRREVRMLVTQLEASLAGADGLELDRAIAEHRALVIVARRRRLFTREADPHGEIRVTRLSVRRRRRKDPRRELAESRAQRPEAHPRAHA